eukprot:c21126_g1_i1 orf=239-1180(+)
MAPAFQLLLHQSCSLAAVRVRSCTAGWQSLLYVSFDAKGNARHSGKSRFRGFEQHGGFLNTMKWLSWQGLAGRRRELGFMQVSANSKAEEPLPSEMSMEDALQILGVAEGASFEEILRAKNSLLGKHFGDDDFASQVEAAYDVLLMRSLTQRRSGKVVDSSIRYADVRKTRISSGLGGPQWFSEAMSKVPVAVETPTSMIIGTQTAVYTGLAVCIFASEVSSQSPLSAKSDVPGVILAVGVGASIYFLRKQNVNLGKAVVLTAVGLVVGSVFGGAVESWLHVDVVPILGIGSPTVVVSEFVLVSLWLSSLYLR